MKCAFSKELLALYIEGDLPGAQSEKVRGHLVQCGECEQFCEQLRQSQLVFKSLRHDMPNAAALAGVRHEVLARTENPETLGWALRMERLLLLGFRKPRYAVAGLAILAIVSVSLLAQIQQPRVHAAIFEGRDTLLRPTNYREWVFVGSSTGLSYAQNSAPGRNGGNGMAMDPMFHNVYIDPVAYREYSRTGEFPEGTVMILEMASAEVKQEPGLQGSYEKDFIALEASVKDSSRFEGGWGYFGFTGADGKLKDRAQAFPEASCRSCHEQKAATDHVFTQFYPVLRSVGAIIVP